MRNDDISIDADEAQALSENKEMPMESNHDAPPTVRNQEKSEGSPMPPCVQCGQPTVKRGDDIVCDNPRCFAYGS